MNTGLVESFGFLNYKTTENGIKLVLSVDMGIYFFYRSLIPKSFDVKPQKYAPHISVVRNETPKNMNFWGKYEGMKVNFLYERIIYKGEVYWWIDAFSYELEAIRTELGLANNIYPRRNPNYEKTFHITLGNCK